MKDIAYLQERYGSLVRSMTDALASGNEEAFGVALDRIMHLREKSVYVELRRLTAHLHGALERFRVDSRLVDIAEKEVPDARHRLDHVLKLTNDAAHKTMDLVEVSFPIADRTAKAAANLLTVWTQRRQADPSLHELRGLLERTEEFLITTRSDCETLRTNLSQVLMAQDYQDLSGQIVRGVMQLVVELEGTLGELVRLASDGNERTPSDRSRTSRTQGPAVPGIDNGTAVSEQKDVDSLLSGLGL